MKSLSLVIPYYMNPGMLAFQYATWCTYPDEVKARVEIIVVDDGSPSEPALDVVRPLDLPPLRIFRVLEDRPWHQHAARNLGADQASGDWLLLTDMDHVFAPEAIAAVLKLKGSDRAYIFPRLDWPELKPTLGRHGERKPHPNTYAMKRDLFWRVGGYDEEFCGIYGTDGLFRERLRRRAVVTLAPETCAVWRFSREVLADASTRTLGRKEAREPHAKRNVRALKKAEGRSNEIRVLAFPWARAL